MGVKPEAEFIRGFGKKQLLQAAVGSLFGGVLACILWFITRNVTAVMITALTVIAMRTKDQSNLSVVDQIQNMIRFGKAKRSTRTDTAKNGA